LVLAACATPSSPARAPEAQSSPGASASAGAGRRGGPLRVVVSTTVLADLARHVAGDRASVTSLAPEGIEVHDYQPKPEDARTVAEADVLVLNGAGLDRWAEKLSESGGRPGARRVTLADGMALIQEPGAGPNPHLWLDAQGARAYTEKLRDAFAAADPDGADTYRANQAAYAQELGELDSWIKQQVGALPPERRKLVTSHDAFPYFARAYGFEIIGFIAPDADHEPSAGELAALVQKVKAANVPAVFGEAGFSPKLAQALGQEAGVRVVTDLYTDSLGSPPADSYVGMMRHDTMRIVEALKA
jgi:ABC-type Zn uptake system ZnuABC Zn-binding protein ZnuA